MALGSNHYRQYRHTLWYDFLLGFEIAWADIAPKLHTNSLNYIHVRLVLIISWPRILKIQIKKTNKLILRVYSKKLDFVECANLIR